MKKFPKKGLYCFFFMYVSYGEENKEDKITANAALRLLCVKQMVTNCQRKKLELQSVPYLHHNTCQRWRSVLETFGHNSNHVDYG